MEVKTQYNGIDLSVENEPKKAGQINLTYYIQIGGLSMFTTKTDWVEISKKILNAIQFIDDNVQ